MACVRTLPSSSLSFHNISGQMLVRNTRRTPLIVVKPYVDDAYTTFTKSLRTALEGAGLGPFHDHHNKIEIEEDLLLRHPRPNNIPISGYSIIIFSKGGAFSEGALDDLVMTLNRKRASEHNRVLFAVYCDVDRYEVERQSGWIREEFSMHEEQEFIKGLQIDDGGPIKDLWDKVKGRREALREVANMPGFTLRNAADGTRIISLIIDLLGGASGQTYMSQSFPYFHGCSGYHISLIFKDELEDNTSGKTFPDRLFVALMKAGFHTFQDDQKIEREDARKQIVQRSNCCIIFFSKCYASSKGRLDELVTILDCYRTCPHRIVPVYDYDVERSDVRNQLGRFREAFAVYEKEIEDETDDEIKGKLRDDVRRRRGALREVAKLPGFDLQNAANGSGSEEVIKKIARVMQDKVTREFAKGPHSPVGLHSRAKTINLWVQGSAQLICITNPSSNISSGGLIS